MNNWATAASRRIGAAASSTNARKKRSPEAPTCRLPGCDEVTGQLPGRPPRSFCSPAHRAAARQLGVQDALRAAAGAGEPGPGPAVADEQYDAPRALPVWPDGTRQKAAHVGASDGGTTASRRGWLTGRRVFAGLAAVAVIGAAVPVVLLVLDRGPRHIPAPTAHARRPRLPAAGSSQDQLLAQSASWSAQAQQALAGIGPQLSALSRAEKAIDAVPAGQRGTRAEALLRQVRQRMSMLAGRQASLSAGLAVWDTYQRSNLEIAGIRGELSYLRQAQQRAKQAHRPAGDIAGLTDGLVKDQNALASQAGTWTADLRKTVSQPVAAVPELPTRQLAGQVGGIIGAVVPSGPAPVSRPAPVTPAASPAPAPSAPHAAAPSQPARPASSGPGSAPDRTASPATSARQSMPAGGNATTSAGPGVQVVPPPTATPSALGDALAQAEAAAGTAIRDESRVLGTAGVNVTFSPAAGVTVTLGPGSGVQSPASPGPSAGPLASASTAPPSGGQPGQNKTHPPAPSPSSNRKSGQHGQSSVTIPFARQLMQWIRWELQFAEANSGYQDTSGYGSSGN